MQVIDVGSCRENDAEWNGWSAAGTRTSGVIRAGGKVCCGGGSQITGISNWRIFSGTKDNRTTTFAEFRVASKPTTIFAFKLSKLFGDPNISTPLILET